RRLRHAGDDDHQRGMPGNLRRALQVRKPGGQIAALPDHREHGGGAAADRTGTQRYREGGHLREGRGPGWDGTGRGRRAWGRRRASRHRGAGSRTMKFGAEDKKKVWVLAALAVVAAYF